MEETITAKIERLAEIYCRRPDSLSRAELNWLVKAIPRTNRTGPHTDKTRLSKGFLSLRDIEDSLARRMWAGFGRAEVAKQVLHDAGETNKRSVDFGPRRDLVAASLEAAFMAGKLTLYVSADEAWFIERFKRVPSWAKEAMPVPKELLGHVFFKDNKGRRRLPASFAIRPSRKLAGNDRLFALLNCGYLVVRETEFKRWLRSERRKRRWPSQKTTRATPKKSPVGRPSGLNSQFRAAILDIAREPAWNGERQPLTKLHRLLGDKGLKVPSVDTLGRMVDALFAETGESGLRRRRRVRRS
jgi:hypothetical protein